MNESVIGINGANVHKPLSAHELHLPGGFQEGHGPPADPFQSILRTGLGNPEGLRQHFLGWGWGGCDFRLHSCILGICPIPDADEACLFAGRTPCQPIRSHYQSGSQAQWVIASSVSSICQLHSMAAAGLDVQHSENSILGTEQMQSLGLHLSQNSIPDH